MRSRPSKQNKNAPPRTRRPCISYPCIYCSRHADRFNPNLQYLRSTQPIPNFLHLMPIPSSFSAFAPSLPLHHVVQSRSKHRCTRTCRRPRVVTACADNSIPNSPSLLLESWRDSRKISSTVDLSRRFISILFLSINCHRAAYAEKQLAKIAETYSIARRLLILSAGLKSNPGDFLPWPIVAAANMRQIDLSEQRPCACFSISDRTSHTYNSPLVQFLSSVSNRKHFSVSFL